jgi:Cd2+/Zn2+-exporting ATPase/Cu+-exporting ATPase
VSIGEYGAAAVIVFFMRFADFLDGYTAGRARQAIQEIVALQPLDARVEDGDGIRMVPAAQVRRDQVVFIKPGERVPVDGVIVSGHASINQAPLTGESIPVARGPGDAVLAATVNLDGALRVRAEHVGPDSTFGRIVRLVEEADAHKSTAQRFAGRVTAYYIPLVAAAAAAAWFVGGSLSASVAVLVVSCSCGIALATPVAVLAAVGRAARRGILIKGGAALEGLARADVVLLDKTGTLTLGRPQVTGVHPAPGRAADEVLAIAARAERYSEHPLAAAIMAAARPVSGGDAVAAVDVAPGRGVKLTSGDRVMVGSRRFLDEEGVAVPGDADALAGTLAAEGHAVVYVAHEGVFAGLIALADRPRAGVAGAIGSLRHLGIREIVMLTGDTERVAAAVAGELGVDYRAGLLPEGKIDDVRRRQAGGRIVAMIGDGINDAPALAQADAGIAMNAATGAALEAADVALMKDDWTLVPEAVRIGREAFAVIRQNLLSAVAYNIIGVSLAVAGVLPPMIAAAGQIIPDVFILLNSGRLLRSRPITR